MTARRTATAKVSKAVTLRNFTLTGIVTAGPRPINYARPLSHSRVLELPPSYDMASAIPPPRAAESSRGFIRPQDLAIFIESSAASVYGDVNDKATKAS